MQFWVICPYFVLDIFVFLHQTYCSRSDRESQSMPKWTEIRRRGHGAERGAWRRSGAGATTVSTPTTGWCRTMGARSWTPAASPPPATIRRAGTPGCRDTWSRHLTTSGLCLPQLLKISRVTRFKVIFQWNEKNYIMLSSEEIYERFICRIRKICSFDKDRDP